MTPTDTAPHVLISSPHHLSLAKLICAADPRITLATVDWFRFPDTMPNTFLHGASQLKNAHVSFLASCHVDSVIFEQVSLMLHLSTLKFRSLKVFLPYYPTGTMERIDNVGQVPTAWTLGKMISGVLPAGPGTVPLYIWDIHALSNRHFFGDNIAPIFKSGVKLLRDKLTGQNVSIAFPDDGARKRFQRMFLIDEENEKSGYHFPFIICDKIHVGDDRIVTIKEGAVKDRDVIIVDDLAHSCGTQLSCKDALFTAGAKSVSAYVTHGVFDNGSEKKLINVGFDTVYLTETCPKGMELDGVGPFRVLSIVPKMVESILE
jgi:phosphoribosylpyrophosphate synthetase